MDKLEIVMTYKKSTKGTHVYGNEDSPIPSVYIRRGAFIGTLEITPPEEIILTIEEKAS